MDQNGSPHDVRNFERGAYNVTRYEQTCLFFYLTFLSGFWLKLCVSWYQHVSMRHIIGLVKLKLVIGTSDRIDAAPSNIENIASDRPFWEFSGISSNEQFKKTRPNGPFFKNFLSSVHVSNSMLIVSLQRWVRLIGHWKVVELIFEMLKEGHIIPETLFQSYKTTNLSMHSR